MTVEERWAYLVRLDDELLVGAAILSEWCSMIVREADVAFARGASLASILTAVAGIETYLREQGDTARRETLASLIDAAEIDDELRADLHRLRQYRNRWVHVDSPWEDGEVLSNPERYEQELEDMAAFAARALRRTIYSGQWL